jgi:isoamylase
MVKSSTAPGVPYILGAYLHNNGTNFALFSQNATAVTLHFFAKSEDKEPTQSLILDPIRHKTGDVWHIWVEGIAEGQLYGYTVDGPYQPWEGHRFNKHKLLLDPYAKAIEGTFDWQDSGFMSYIPGHPQGDLSFSEEYHWNKLAKSVVVDTEAFDWEDHKAPLIPLRDSIIYETHVRAQTKLAEVSHPGTYLGMAEMIPYFLELGVTTLELLPIHSFHPGENIRENPETGEKLVNFWGYSTIGFFAPCGWFATDGKGLTAVKEFKQMIKAFHAAGIEVILDVVYNHTGEGNEMGPTLSYRGLDNSIYYMLEKGRYYKNYSGCGNTLNCNHPVVKTLILDSLRYWVVDMKVDGFRFDLAAILGRDLLGNWVPNYSVLNDISHDPILSGKKLIAEGWDAAGLYQVGGFPPGWAEWNGPFRDDVRAYVKGDPGLTPRIADRIGGSSDLFHYGDRKPYHSINFITAHDGFTLWDLVSYNQKHNFANGEDDRDGANHNLSWNHGTEGLTKDKEIIALRKKQVKNFFVHLLVSQGTPMILAGDEFAFTKKGNNNTYCHDNELNWLDWDSLEDNKDIFDFARFLIFFRKRHPVLRRENFFRGVDHAGNQMRDITWLNPQGTPPLWEYEHRAMAFHLDGHPKERESDVWDNCLYVAFNPHWEPVEFILPEWSAVEDWEMVVNTAMEKGFWEPDGPRVKDKLTLAPDLQ